MNKLSAPTEALALAEVRQWARTGEARRTREQAHLSLSEMAAATGVTFPTISRWERGLRVPRGTAALRYHALLTSLDKQSKASVA